MPTARSAHAKRKQPAAPLYALRQRGYDLLQLSLAIAVSIAVLVAGLLLFQSIRSNAAATSRVREMTMITTEVASLLQYGGDVALAQFTEAKDGRSAFLQNYLKITSISPSITARYFMHSKASPKPGVTMRLVIGTDAIPAPVCQKLRAANPLNSAAHGCQKRRHGTIYFANIDL